MKSTIISCLISAIVIALSTQSAQASAYKTSSGSTYIHIQELAGGAGPNVGMGYYSTMSAGQQWNGNIALTASTMGGNRVYTGNFTDFAGPSKKCTGTLKLTRPTVLNPNAPTPMTATWTIGPGGINCPSPIGAVITLNLTEALPVADGNGNFQPNSINGNTIVSQTSGIATWPKWWVIDPSNLNCRQTAPSGPIVTSFTAGTLINVAQVPMPNKFITAGGNPWLQIQNTPSCFVRAKSTLIKPAVMPF